jgi:hypothetical protein
MKTGRLSASNRKWANRSPGAKASADSAPRGGLVPRLRMAWTALMDSLVPWGYEDERGIHYGEIAVRCPKRCHFC